MGIREAFKRIEIALGKRLASNNQKAAYYLLDKVRKAVDVQAPRGFYKDKQGQRHDIALTRARHHAPPRKLTGRLRASIRIKHLSKTGFEIVADAKSDKGFPYPLALEHGYVAKAGSYFPIVAAGLARRYKGRAIKMKPGDVSWVKRRTAKTIDPHPFIEPTRKKYWPAIQRMIYGR